MGEVKPDTPMGTGVRNGHDSTTSETVAAIFWDPKQGTFRTTHPPCIQEVLGDRKAGKDR
jgi:hypothetical protein